MQASSTLKYWFFTKPAIWVNEACLYNNLERFSAYLCGWIFFQHFVDERKKELGHFLSLIHI